MPQPYTLEDYNLRLLACHLLKYGYRGEYIFSTRRGSDWLYRRAVNWVTPKKKQRYGEALRAYYYTEYEDKQPPQGMPPSRAV